MLGRRTSIPNTALPSVFAGTSARADGLPIRVQSLRSLRLTFRGVCAAAACANSPKCADLPEAWLITPSFTLISCKDTFHWSAAAKHKLAFAVAAARRKCSHASFTDEEPPVALTPNSRATLPTIHSPLRTRKGLSTPSDCKG